MKLLTLLLILILLGGCLGQAEKISTNKVTEILAEPASYEGKTINLNATVIQMSTSPMGVVYRLNDGTGEITGVYTGDIQVIDMGASAIFSGEVIRDASLAGVHGEGVFMRILGVKDVTFGEVEMLPSTVFPTSGTPTIDDINKNSYAYSQQDTVYVSGKTTQTQDAANYTYVEIDDGTGRMWVAIPKGQVPIGVEVVTSGFLMINFQSKTLAKTFDALLFSTGLQFVESKAPSEINVSKAEGGYRIEEIYAKKDTLKDTSVKVRGIAVKISSGIMSMTWIHLQDGSGSASENTDDILVTYSGHQEVKVGDEIIVTGTVALNKDLGPDMKFDILIENTSIQKV